MLNIIQIWLVVSENKIFKVFYIDYISVQSPPPVAMFFLDIINLQEGHLQTTSAKYQYNLASGFRGEDFLSFLHRHIRELAPPPCFLRYHHEFQKLARGSSKVYSCQISFKSGQWFQRRRFFKFSIQTYKGIGPAPWGHVF